MDAHPFEALNLPVDFEKLAKVVKVLMDRVERGVDAQANAYALFQTAIVLDNKVRERTQTLETALRQLETTNRELKAAKEQTEAAQTRLMEAINSISEGFVHCDADDRLVLCNHNFLEFWPGLEDVIYPGIPFAEVSRWTVDLGLVLDAEYNRASWLAERLQRHRAPAEPFVIRVSSGRWLQISERILPDGGTVSIYTDISETKLKEQRRHERELAQKSILLQSTLDNLAQGVSVFDDSLRLVAWNDRFVTLLKLPDWLIVQGTRFEDFVRFRGERGDYGSDADGAMAVRIESARRACRLHTEQMLANGVVLEVRRDPMPQGGFVTTYTDVTEPRAVAAALNEAKSTLERRVCERTAELTEVNRKLREEIRERARAEDALWHAKADAEAANLGKTRFLAAASHDLLQPLNAARLFVTALSERSLGHKEGELVSRVDSALGNVEMLLGALLDISKFDAGAIPVDVSDFRVDMVLSALQEEFDAVAAAAGLDLRVVRSSAIVRSDPRLLGRILRNLLSNAIRYTPSGRVLLGCRRTREGLWIEVRDTGIGIPEGHLDDIFEEFKQLKMPGRRSETGFGLGLAIVQRISRTLGHEMSVRSTLGRGSVFAVKVPYGHQPVGADRVDPSSLETVDSIAGASVLVIDNEAGVLIGMREVLEGWGCAVTAERSGAQAIAQFDGNGAVPQIAIVDYHLDDGENGLDVIRSIRSRCRWEVPGLIITADPCPGLHDTIRHSGLHALRKPVKPAKLRALMSHVLAEQSALKRRIEYDLELNSA